MIRAPNWNDHTHETGREPERSNQERYDEEERYIRETTRVLMERPSSPSQSAHELLLPPTGSQATDAEGSHPVPLTFTASRPDLRIPEGAENQTGITIPDWGATDVRQTGKMTQETNKQIRARRARQRREAARPKNYSFAGTTKRSRQ